VPVPGLPTPTAASTGQVRLADIADERFPKGEISEVDKGSFISRTGKALFYWVLFATCLALVGLFYYLFQNTPAPVVPTKQDSTGVALSVELAKVLADQRAAAFANFVTGIEKLIVGVFLPILTAILGYLFGRAEATKPKTVDSAG
jgi:hypothetical protein